MHLFIILNAYTVTLGLNPRIHNMLKRNEILDLRVKPEDGDVGGKGVHQKALMFRKIRQFVKVIQHQLYIIFKLTD